MSLQLPQPATGEQFEISRAGARAVVTELAGCLRLFERDGVQLTETFGDEEIPPGATGILLAPWPNRVAGGQWLLHGRRQQLDITEPSLGNASHGLLRNTGYRPVSRTAASILLRAEIFPQHGYPFRLTHEASYSIDGDGGLTVTQSLINLSPEPAPAAFGAHPYLRLGAVDTGELTLTVPGASWLSSDEKLIPTGKVAAEGPMDLRAGIQVAGRSINAAFTDLARGSDGRARSTLTAPDGHSVCLWQDEIFPYVHVFVTDNFPGRPVAVALEPMTAPANALNSGDGLRWLEPGASLSGSWGIAAAPAPERA
ncbi:aldose 1-epimerase family protein [Arthrobacter sp. I2-34]|uniref:Aldose 1-epimerase family protein n=1 Tax=Arthrobacter hankyongi TaxID=2904801 RepID=A0ABS9L272_9MICC|nr:aldose 1-epimerase family protein [Arthrobacter hankyongi]MCG2620624.1 aldose 1-epimerase family protein [Arthrobacter hankyongi]